MVIKLPKQPGSREHRWVHLLCGTPAPLQSGEEQATATGSTTTELAERVARLESEILELRAAVQALAGEEQAPLADSQATAAER